jgi:hypothetical protein
VPGAEFVLGWSAQAASVTNSDDHDFVIHAIERNKLKK